jgi:hypothetical protein
MLKIKRCNKGHPGSCQEDEEQEEGHQHAKDLFAKWPESQSATNRPKSRTFSISILSHQSARSHHTRPKKTRLFPEMFE